MKNIDIEGIKYEIIENYKDAFNQEEFINRWTIYFEDYDYILGDISYGKLRLKGFYNTNNKKVNTINNHKNIEDYLKKYCSKECSYFILKKM